MHNFTNPYRRGARYIPKTDFLCEGTVRCLTFSRDGQFLAAGIGNTIVVWRSQSFETPSLKFIAHDQAAVSCLDWKSCRLFCAYSTGEVSLLDFEQEGTNLENSGGRQFCVIDGFDAVNEDIRFLDTVSSGECFAVGGEEDVTVWQRKAPGWVCQAVLKQPAGLITSVGWKSLQGSVVVVSYLDHGIITWNVTTGAKMSVVTPGSVPHSLLSPDGIHFAVLNGRSTFDLYDIEKRIYVQTLSPNAKTTQMEPHSANPPFTFMDGGVWFLSGDTGCANLWHLGTNEYVPKLELGDRFQQSIMQLLTHTSVTGSDGSTCLQIATCVDDASIVIWEIRNSGTQARIFWKRGGCTQFVTTILSVGSTIALAAWWLWFF